MKKTSLFIISSLLFVGALFAAPKKTEPVEPQKVIFSEANRWGTDATLADGVYADGTVTYTAMYRYGGGGYTFKVNGKSGINLKNYSTCEIEFDYEVASWENQSVFPKFAVKTFGSGATFYNGGQALTYIDGEALKGTIKQSIDLSGKTGKIFNVGVVANSWQWAGNGNGNDTGDDTVVIKLKSITFLP